jgi:ATP-dependent DNA ligase
MTYCVVVYFDRDAEGDLNEANEAESQISSSQSKRTALRYAGAVGTGFSDATMRMLRKVFDPLAQNRSAVASLKVKGAV